MQNIRKLYAPIQPAVESKNCNVTYSEFLPEIQLQSSIYCYWELKTNTPLKKQYSYKVVADGCIDIFFELENPQENFVMGFCNHFSEFSLGKSFHYVGVRFFPSIFPRLFRIDASELSNSVELLGNIDSHISNFIAGSFQPGQTTNDIKTLFDKYFLNLLKRERLDLDKRIDNAIQLIIQRGGQLRVEKDLDTGFSPRQLRRLFNFYVGDTAKVFSKVIRFQKILQSDITAKNRALSLFEEGDFFDQSHFIKDFKNFYGSTPGKVLKK